MKVKFLVRDSRVGKDGTSPIELSIIINNERKVITLDRRCNPSKWDSRTQKVKGSKDLNDYINLVRSQCYALHSEMVSPMPQLRHTLILANQQLSKNHCLFLPLTEINRGD